MAGDGSDPVIELQTNFGGGRIHSMLALYHLFSGCPVADLTGLEEYVPDLIAFSALVVDTKVIEAIANHERVRMLNYLRIVGLKVGVIMNFMRTKLEWERIVLSNRE